MRAERQTETLATALVRNKQMEVNNAFSQIIWLPLSTLTSSFFTAIHSELFTCKYIKNRWEYHDAQIKELRFLCKILSIFHIILLAWTPMDLFMENSQEIKSISYFTFTFLFSKKRKRYNLNLWKTPKYFLVALSNIFPIVARSGFVARTSLSSAEKCHT